MSQISIYRFYLLDKMWRISILFIFVLTGNIFAQSRLVSPANNWVQKYSDPIYFSWNDCTSCNSFELQLSSDSAFTLPTTYNVSSTDTSIVLNEGVYFWRISGINSNAEILWTSEIRSFTLIDLNSLGSLEYWFDPEFGVQVDGSNAISSWVSNSTNLYEVNQATSSMQPILLNDVINGKSGVSFDGTDQLNGGSVALGSVFSVFMHNNTGLTIHSGLISPVANPRFALSLGSTGQVLATYSSAFTNFRVNQTVTSTVPSNIWLLVSSVRANTQNFATFSFSPAHSGYNRIIGLMMENIGYSTVLSESDKILIEDYLRCKFAPPVNLGQNIHVPYGFCDTTIRLNTSFENQLWSNGSVIDSLVVSAPGVYWVECTDRFGIVSRDTIEVSYPEYTPPVNTVFCPNGTVTWEALSANDYLFNWSDGTTNQINQIGLAGDYFVTISDTNGCQYTTPSYTFSEDIFPSQVSLGNDTSLCSGNEISFLNGYNESESFVWSTSENTQSIVINTSGLYSIQATNDNGCIGNDTIEVTIIGDAPALSYSIPTEICQGSELSYSESSTVPPGNNISGLIWDFGDSDSSVVSSGIHVYVDSGAFNASLEVFTLEGCKSKDEFIITVFPKPIVSFETENYCPYEEIGFTPSNSYAVPLGSYNWDLGQGGSTSTDSNPNYVYGTSGNYDVQLIAIDTNNCSDTVTQSVYIQPAPIADISILNPCELSALEITDNSSISDTFSIVTYSWDYGDNTSAVNPVEDKFYELYGEYTVQLALIANNGCVDSIEQNITVHPNPIVDYAVGPACMGTWTALTDLSVIPMGSLAETNWLINLQYSDNQSSTAFNFPTTGIQLVALQSTSDQGCAVDTTFTIDVADELKADFLATPSALTTGTPILFSNQSIGMDSSFWDFGDGNGVLYNTNSINEITYDSSLNGSSIDVSLVIVNNLGCRDTSAQSYELKEAFFDLAVQTIFVQDINGFLTVGAEIQNLGSVPLENAELYLKTPENSPILENWTGFLAQNESEIYIFNAHPPSYTSTQDETERFICVEGNGINSLGYVDIDFSNNTACKNIEGSGLVVLPIYPNPTEEDITLSILLTETSTVHIELIDQRGRVVLNEKQTEDLEAGIHTFRLPFSELNKGVYFVRVSDNTATLLEKIVRY